MPITLKYGAPGPTLLAGYAAGKGRRQNDLQDKALERWQRQQLLRQQQGFQADQAALDRNQRDAMQQAALGQAAEQAKLGREFQAGQQKTALTFQETQADLQRKFQEGQQKALLDSRTVESGLDRKQRLAEQQRQQDFIADQRTMAGLQSGELVLPESAQKRLRQLEAGRVDALKLAPAQQEQFRSSYEAERRALIGLAQPVRETSYDERVKKGLGSNYEQYKNLPWQFNDQGQMSLPSGFKPPGDAARDFQEGVLKRYERLRGQMNEETDERISDDAARKAAIEEQMQAEQFRQQLSGRGGQGDPRQPQNLPRQQPPAQVPRISGPTSPEYAQQPQPGRMYGQAPNAGQQAGPLGPAPQGSATGNFMNQRGPQAPSAAYVSRTVAAQFDQKWAQLPVGQAMVGPDGKVHIKRKP